MAGLQKSRFVLQSRLLFGGSKSASTATAAASELKPYSEIPGPKGLPLLGNAIQAFKSVPNVDPDPKNLLKIAPELFKMYGPIMRLEAPGVKMVWLMCPELAEKALRAAGPVPRRPGFKAIGYVREKGELFAEAPGLLTAQGSDWQQFRRQVQQPMLRPKSAVGYTEKIEEIAQEFIDSRVRPRRDPKTGEMPEDFLYELYRWALESVAFIALNTRLGCFGADLEAGSEQMEVIDAVRDIFQTNANLDQALLQWWRSLPSQDMRRFLKATEVFQTVTTKYVGQAMRRIAEAQSREDDPGPPTLLELFAARGCSEQVATVMALDMIFAGIDTSSHTSAFFLYHLAKNPQVQDRLREEVTDALPSADSRLTDKSFDRMPYMKAALKEVLRMCPPAVANARLVEEDLELAGYNVPAGTEIATFHYVMGNSPVYVRDPEEFRPERFMKGSPMFENLHPFLLLPFGHGPRMCVGRRFAELEVYTFMTKMIQNFKIEWHRDPLEYKVATLTYPSSPLRFTLIDN